MATTLDEFEKVSCNIEGYFNLNHARIWDSMLNFQNQQKKEGFGNGFLEIGSLYGKSAAMLAVHANENERVHLLDLGCRPPLVQNVEMLRRETGAKIDLIKGYSLTTLFGDYSLKNEKRFRWIHIDGGHGEEVVFNDLECANKLLSPRGVIVMDDFYNVAFPQITQVTYDFLRSHDRELSLILTGFNKGYLIRPVARALYQRYITDNLRKEAIEWGMEIREGTHSCHPSFGIRHPPKGKANPQIPGNNNRPSAFTGESQKP